MTLGGIVLAGGRSRRMGRPKADLDWHGTPLVAHVAAAVAAATGGPVVVVRAPEQRLPSLPAGTVITTDPVAGLGPLQGLAAGLAALDADIAFVCATDQPFAHEVLPALLAASAPGADAVAYPGQPLGALYRTALAAVAQQRLAAGEASLRGLLAAVRTHAPAGPVPAALRSLDTPEAYASALSPRS